MGAAKGAFDGNSFVGIFAKANDEIGLVPINSHPKFDEQMQSLGVELVKTSVDSSPYLGIYSAMNSKGIILPPFLSDEELEPIKKSGLNVHIIEDSRYAAIGNNIACNDRGALINPNMPKKMAAEIEDCLGVEVVQERIIEYSTPGMMVVATNRGWFSHNRIDEKHKELFEGLFKVEGLNGTINAGVSMVGIGVVANSKAAVVGQDSTGYELSRIEQALDIA
jgi:translation initiation factor 6